MTAGAPAGARSAPTAVAGRGRSGGGPPGARSARAVAIRALVEVDGGARANVVVPSLLATSGLVQRDKAFVTELVYGTVRMRRAVDWVLHPHVRRRPDPDVRAALRLGAYQLIWLKTPAHAAVSATVDALGGPAKGFVNAVLRRVADHATNDVGDWPDDATRLSYPDWIVHRLQADLGEAPALDALAAMNEAASATFRNDGYVQDLGSQWVAAAVGAESGQRIVDLCAAPGGKATWMAYGAAGPSEGPGSPGGQASAGDWAAEVAAAGGSGAAEVAAAGGSGAAEVAAAGGSGAAEVAAAGGSGAAEVAAAGGSGAAEVAAAGGSGAAEVAAAGGSGAAEVAAAGRMGTVGVAAPGWARPALVVAADIDQARARMMAANAAGLGLTNVATVVADACLPPLAPACFDRVLVDAPCSGLGVLRRRPDARWRIQPGDLPRLAALQRRLLEAALPLVAPGGILVYSVCTMTLVETAGIDRWLASTHPEARPVAPPGAPWERVGRGARLLPQAAGTDGMFMLAVQVAGSG